MLSTSALAVDKYRVAVAELQISDAIPASQAKRVKDSSLMADIENAIRNGRKFELLTRRQETLTAIREEQKFATSELAAGDAATTGLLANAQALVQVEVLNFSYGRSSKKIPNLDNKYKVSDYCSIELSVQIVDTERGSVLASFPIKASSSSGSSITNGVGRAGGSVLDRTLQSAAAKLVNQMSDTIHWSLEMMRICEN